MIWWLLVLQSNCCLPQIESKIYVNPLVLVTKINLDPVVGMELIVHDCEKCIMQKYITFWHFKGFNEANIALERVSDLLLSNAKWALV